jgi:hypothetical protein
MINQQPCTACGRLNREQARFCGYCGQPLQVTAQKKEDSFSVKQPLEEAREALHTFSSAQIAGHGFNEPSQKSTGGRTMKSLASAIFTVALLGLLVYTNPTLEGYESFLHQQILEDAARQSDALTQTLGYFFGSFASSVITNMTIRKDYVFWSTYDTKIGDEHLRVLGIMKNFFILETPRSLATRR